MTLAPIEIQKKEFHRSFRGYNEEEVKSFLEKISMDYEKIYKQNQDLKEEIKQLQEKLQVYKDMESTLKNTLILAEKTAEDTRRNALKEKEIILKEALAKAGKLVDRAEQRYVSLNNQYEELRRHFSLFKTRFSNFLQSQIEIVNSCELNEMEEDRHLFDSFRQAAAGYDEEIKKEYESDRENVDDMDVSEEAHENPDDMAAQDISEESDSKNNESE
jgi:cell division initiation protein